MDDDDLLILLGLGALGFLVWSHWGDGSSLDVSQYFGGITLGTPSVASTGADGGDLSPAGSAPLTWGESLLGGSSVMTPSQIYDLASQILGSMGITDITPSMATCIALNESGGDPNAMRNEPQINDASYGLMQTLLGTATWLHDQMGYTAYDATSDNLLTPGPSMYFGCAYLHWLRNYHGINDDAFVVAAYNGGPGNPNGAGPQRYLASWQNYMNQNGWSA